MVELTYDPAVLSTRQLLTEFFSLHDFSQDRIHESGGQYRSAIFYPAGDNRSSAALRIAYDFVETLEQNGFPVSTQIRPVEAFYPADPRHQQYCAAKGITPKKREAKHLKEILTASYPPK